MLEDLTLLGHDAALGDVPRLSQLNWLKYLQHVMRGEYDEAPAGDGGHELPITNFAEPARLPKAG